MPDLRCSYQYYDDLYNKNPEEILGNTIEFEEVCRMCSLHRYKLPPQVLLKNYHKEQGIPLAVQDAIRRHMWVVSEIDKAHFAICYEFGEEKHTEPLTERYEDVTVMGLSKYPLWGEPIGLFVEIGPMLRQVIAMCTRYAHMVPDSSQVLYVETNICAPPMLRKAVREWVESQEGDPV